MINQCVRPLRRDVFVIITTEERASIDGVKFVEEVIDAD
jgi:hypothetical protein